jgi:hypothetical protein
MRLLPEHKCIFIHIPKTGGNSITKSLDGLSNCRALGRDARPFLKHVKARDMKAGVDGEVWGSHFKFAVVRNPWDQMVSCYHWWLQKASRLETHQESVAEIRAMDGFGGFMRSPYGGEMLNQCTGSSYDWVSDDAGGLLVDYVGRFETLNESWGEICDRLGVERTELKHLNQTKRTHYRDYYTDETRDIVARRFARLIEEFGYSF